MKEVAIKKVVIQPENMEEIINELKVIVDCDTRYCVDCFGSYYKVSGERMIGEW